MQHLNDLIAQFEQYLLNRLFRSMDNYASEEIKEIENALNSDSFFNLTDEKIKPELIENLKLGKKYSPKTNYSIKSEIEKFNKEIIAIINSYVKSEFKISVKLDHKDLVRDIMNMIKTNLPIQLKEFLVNAIQSYKKKKIYF